MSESSKFSSFYLLYKRDVVLPIDNLLKPRRKYQADITDMLCKGNINLLLQSEIISKRARKDRQSMHTKIQRLLNLRLVTRFITRIIKEKVNWT